METTQKQSETLPIIDVAYSMETTGYFRDAPRVIDIANEPRDNLLIQRPNYALFRGIEVPDEPQKFTEAEGMQNLLSVLSTLEQSVPPEKAEYVHYFRENLTYLGSKEFEEAAKGLAAYIYVFAVEHPDKKICLPMPYNRKQNSEGLVHTSVIDEIMNLTSEDTPPPFLIDYETARTLDADEVQYFLMDDWSVSGTDMRGRLVPFDKVAERDKLNQSVQPDLSNVEVLLMAVRDDQLEHYSTQSVGGRQVSCRGYFRAPAPYINHGYGPVPSGSHSSVDYGFEQAIDSMATDALKQGTLSEPLSAAGTPIRLQRSQRDW